MAGETVLHRVCHQLAGRQLNQKRRDAPCTNFIEEATYSLRALSSIELAIQSQEAPPSSRDASTLAAFNCFIRVTDSEDASISPRGVVFLEACNCRHRRTR
jgi:hypothetical protein